MPKFGKGPHCIGPKDSEDYETNATLYLRCSETQNDFKACVGDHFIHQGETSPGLFAEASPGPCTVPSGVHPNDLMTGPMRSTLGAAVPLPKTGIGQMVPTDPVPVRDSRTWHTPKSKCRLSVWTGFTAVKFLLIVEEKKKNLRNVTRIVLLCECSEHSLF